MNNLSQTQLPKQIVDSTSFVYTNAGEPVPLADYFLNLKYLDSEHLKLESPASGKLSVEVVNEKTNSKPALNLQYSDWVLLILLGLFSLVAFVRISGKNYLYRVFTSITNYSYSNSFFKEKNLAYTLNNNLLMIVFYFSAALFLSLSFKYFGYHEVVSEDWPQFFFLHCTCFSICSFIQVGLFFIRNNSWVFILSFSEYLFFFGNTLKILGIAYVILTFGSFFATGTTQSFFVYTTIFMTIFMVFCQIL